MSERADRSNEGKTDFTQLSRAFLDGVSRVLMMGERKYDRHNWKQSINTDQHDAWVQTCNECMMRHIYAYLEGETFDQESGLHHLDHAAANIMFIKEYRDKDTRGRDKALADEFIGEFPLPPLTRDLLTQQRVDELESIHDDKVNTLSQEELREGFMKQFQTQVVEPDTYALRYHRHFSGDRGET